MPVVIPELALIVGLFFAVVGYLVARGLLSTYTHTIGYFLHAVASALVFSVPLTFGHRKIDLGGPVRALDHGIVTAMQNWCDGAEIQMGYCLHGLEKVARFMSQAIDSLGRETSATFDWLADVHIPKWAKYALGAAFPFAYLSKLIAAQIAKALPHIRTEIHTITHDVPRVTVKVLRQSVAGTLTIPKWVLHIPRELRGVETQAGRLSKRIGRVEALLGVTAMAAAMANVLGIPNPRCLRKGPLGRIARTLCGIPTSLLNDVLGLLADFFLLENVCTVLPWLETAASDIGTPLVELLTTVGAGLCDDNQRPAALRGPKASVPTLIFGVSASGV